MTRELARLTNAALDFPARRPVTTLVVFAAFTALAVIGVTRLRPDTSLEAMFARNDPAADALVSVLNRFGAVEELLVLVTAPDALGAPAGPQPDKLVGFAQRFEHALNASPESAALVDGILYRPDADTRKFVQEVLVPSGILYLDDAAFAQARRRLTPEGMRGQLRRQEALLSQPGPVAAAAAKTFAQDPLRLNEFLKPRLAEMGGGFMTGGEQDAILSPDGRALLIRVIGRRPPSDLAFCKSLVAAATRAAQKSNADGLGVSFGGAYAIATHSEQSLRADSRESVTGAFVGLIVLFALVYRRPVRLLLLAVGPLALGSVLGFGAYAFFSRSATILSAAVGAMMVGMGIDYSVHYLTHYEKRRGAGLDAAGAASETSRALFAALFAAWITSVMGFAVVGWSDISALGDFALLGSLGLAGVFVASLTVIPALLVLTDGKAAPRHGSRTRLRFSVDPVLAWVARHARACVACSLAVFVLALGVGLLLPGRVLPLEPDLTVMHPRPNPALHTQDEISRRFGAVPGSLIVYLRADSPEHLVTLAHDVDAHLHTPAMRDAGITGTVGLASVLPDPRTAERRRGEIPPGEADRVAKDFLAALEERGFAAERFERYAGFLRQLLSHREAPTLADLVKYRRLAQLMLPSAALQPGGGSALPTEAITLVSLVRPIDERDLRAAAVNATRAAVAGVPGATVTGLPVLAHDAEHRVAREVPRVFGLALAMVLVYVLAHFRSPRDALLSMTTAAFGMVVLLAVMRLAGVRLNMVNLVALPLLIGMTIDYGIFLVSLARIGRTHGGGGTMLEHVGSSAQAVIVCAGTTLLGFGSLAFTSVPAVRSLGVVIVVGMAAALAGALFLLAPLLLLGDNRRRRP